MKKIIILILFVMSFLIAQSQKQNKPFYGDGNYCAFFDVFIDIEKIMINLFIE
jgi:hypothetical protein